MATSVAEEGLGKGNVKESFCILSAKSFECSIYLDIAEVDLIVFFDVVASPIRQVQREGRTARKRAGRVVVLASNKAEADRIGRSSEQVCNR